jgi:hypothetical protein
MPQVLFIFCSFLVYFLLIQFNYSEHQAVEIVNKNIYIYIFIYIYKYLTKNIMRYVCRYFSETEFCIIYKIIT